MIRLVVAALLYLIPAAHAIAQPATPVHHDIQIWLDPDERYLRATVRTTVFETGAVTVRLAPWLELSMLELDGEPVFNSGQQPKMQLELGEGDSHEILFEYAGVLPPRQSDQSDSATATPLMGPQGSYLPGGSGWLPTLGPGHVTYRLEVSVPDRYRAIASGRLVDEHLGGGIYKAAVTNYHPAEEPSLFAGPYVIREHWHGGIRLRTYFHEDLADMAEDYLLRSARYLDRFSERIGDYPFADFFVISSPLPVGLGFPNLTYVGRKVLPLAFMRGRSLAHEILHNWWGNGVYVDYPGGNWSEGLTTYMADYALAADRGAGEARDMRLQWLRDFAALPTERDIPVVAFTTKTHDADQVIGYDKVAFIFHMLERDVGASAFADGIRAFWKRHRFVTAGWSDLRRAFEDASGRDLSVFFQQWLERPGAPDLRLIDATTKQGPDGEQVSVTVGQDAPPYRLPVPMIVETSDRDLSATAPLSGTRATEVIAVKARPRSVSVDPGYDLFRRLDPSETPPILRAVTLDPTAVAIVATADADAEALARQLATRLLGPGVRFASLDPPPDNATPVLLIGTGADVGKAMAAIGAGSTPDTLSGMGTARAWAGRRADGDAACAVVAADTKEALAAVFRSLPHYGRMSYLAFEGGEVIDKGVWPVTATPLRRVFIAR